MKAIGHYVIIEELPEEVKKTTGGLLLNEKVRDDIRYRKGVIVSVGTAIDTLKPGELVMYDRSAGHKTDILCEEMRVITIRDIVAIL